MDILIWINTLVILFALVGGGIVINSQVRDIAKALAQVEEAAASLDQRYSASVKQPLTPILSRGAGEGQINRALLAKRRGHQFGVQVLSYLLHLAVDDAEDLTVRVVV
jgi:hypothetical protein